MCLQSQAMTWQSSQQAAYAYGADLVSIRCLEQNARLTQLTTEYVWVGGNDLTTEGDWMFPVGGSMTYTNWAPNEPNDAYNEDCLQFNWKPSGQWNDARCSNSYKAIYYSASPISGLSCMPYVCK